MQVDRVVQGRGKPMAVAMLGFAARDASVASGALRLQDSEVADAWWVDTRWVDAAHLEWKLIELSSMIKTVRNHAAARAALRMLGCDVLKFAAIPLPPPPVVAGADGATAPLPLPAADPRRAQYELWGLTLAFFSDLLRTAEAGQPLVGEGAPSRFAGAYTSSSESLVARGTFALLEHARVHGAHRTAASVLGASLALVAAAAGTCAAWARR